MPRRDGHPVAETLAWVAAAVCVGWATGARADPWLALGPGLAVAVVAVLVSGWATDSRDWIRAGMLLSVILWTWQAGVGALVIRSPTSAMIGAGIAWLAARSYVREVRRPPRRRA